MWPMPVMVQVFKSGTMTINKKCLFTVMYWYFFGNYISTHLQSTKSDMVTIGSHLENTFLICLGAKLAHCMFVDYYCVSRDRDSVNSAITVIVSGVITSKSISHLIHDCRVSTDRYPTKNKQILKRPM